jgi:hypothetical protein
VQEKISFFWEWLTERDKHFKDYIIFPFSIIIVFSLLLIIYALFINAGLDDAIFEQKDCEHTSLNFWLKHCGFRFDIIWFILITYALFAGIIYKKTLFNSICMSKSKSVIRNVAIKKYLTSKHLKLLFFIFL